MSNHRDDYAYFKCQMTRHLILSYSLHTHYLHIKKENHVMTNVLTVFLSTPDNIGLVLTLLGICGDTYYQL